MFPWKYKKSEAQDRLKIGVVGTADNAMQQGVEWLKQGIRGVYSIQPITHTARELVYVCMCVCASMREEEDLS